MSHLMTNPTKWHVHPAKTQISLGIRPVWSGASLSAWRNIGSSAIYWAQWEDSDQTRRMPRLIWVFDGRTCQFVGFCHEVAQSYIELDISNKQRWRITEHAQNIFSFQTTKKKTKTGSNTSDKKRPTFYRPPLKLNKAVKTQISLWIE